MIWGLAPPKIHHLGVPAIAGSWVLYSILIYVWGQPWMHITAILPVALTARGGGIRGVASGCAAALIILVDYSVRWGPLLPDDSRSVVLFGTLLFPVVGMSWGWMLQRYHEREIALQRLRATYKATSTIHSAVEPGDIYDQMVRLMVDDLGYPNSAIFECEEDGTLVLRALAGFAGEVDFDFTLAPREGIAARAVRSGSPLLVRNVREDPDYVDGLPGAEAQLTIPLTSDREVMGVLVIESPDPEAFSPDDVQLLQALAEQTAVAMEKTHLLRKNRRMAITDALTGLYNHGYFKRRLGEEIDRAQRTGTQLGLLMLDIDDFKDINDTHGHLAGDRILQTIATIIRRGTRRMDITCRYGGEEFAVILPQTQPPDIHMVAERLRRQIEDHPFRANGEPVHITVSIGTACVDASCPDWNAAIKSVDAALYRAKISGKNTVMPAG